MTEFIEQKPRVYLETSVVSYLTARRSRDLLIAAHQQVTIDWWDTQRQKFRLVGSQLVLQEASMGDPEAVQRRLKILDSVTFLDIDDETKSLANQLIKAGVMPSEYPEDALHISIAVVNGVEYLLTWNYKHMVSAKIRSSVEGLCRQIGYEPTLICTPEELMEE
jgi:hypothetical protein